jgi:hypothetical protein
MKRLSAKQKVLKQFPTAKRMYTRKMELVIGVGISTVLGKTWAEAAKNLK